MNKGWMDLTVGPVAVKKGEKSRKSLIEPQFCDCPARNVVNIDCVILATLGDGSGFH